MMILGLELILDLSNGKSTTLGIYNMFIWETP